MKTIVITGAGTGIGLATTKKFLDNGWSVIGAHFRHEIPIEHKNLTKIKFSLSSPDDIKRAAREIASLDKKIDLLFNNAGVLLDEDDIAIDIDKLRKTLEVNLIGLIDFTERLLPLMNPGGHIVNMSSMAGGLTSASGHYALYYPAYRISKTAINMYTKTLAGRLAPQGITVSSLDPGWVRTDMGGDEAPRLPEEAADDIFKLVNKKIESGFFWHQGRKREW